jgi:putative tryptophan/tyrosine transport system substrate-binding protein
VFGASFGLASAGELLAYGEYAGLASASYVDKIVKGAKPADLPFQKPIKFELG